MVVVFTVAAFLSATLLFAVQPLATRMVLPDFGGSAAVWTTSVLFFQVTLLLGYLYTHVATTRLRPRTQVRVHLVLFLVPAVVLPLAVSATPGEGGTTAVVLRLLGGLAAGVGLPFLLVSTSGPLLQRWFSWTDHPRASDPYFLYAASNVGSILGLVSYPVLVEPLLDVRAQAVAWTLGYGLLGASLLAAALRVPATPSEPPATPTPAATGDAPAASGARVGGPARWVWVAFLPSSLMLGVTTFLSTDVAAVPLLWVAPLAVYLATFVVAFGGGDGRPAEVCQRVAGPLALLAATSVLVRLPLPLTIALVVATFGALAMVVHQRLADSRPPATGLTAFYVWIAVGGALGGLLNGVVAPVVLPGPFEFPLVALATVVVAGAALEDLVGGTRSVRFWGTAMVVTLGTVGLGVVATRGLLDRRAVVAVAVALTAFLLLSPGGRSRLGMLGAVALLAVPAVGPYVQGSDLTARSFFGSYRVTTTQTTRAFFSGTTLHGIQSREPADAARPLSYYHPEGPLGDWLPLAGAPGTIGVVGLGAGSVAAYGRAGDRVVFHEIDPLVVEVARSWFTYLDDSPADVGVVAGDGRLTLADVPDGAYDVLVVDAFSSDAIPVHLLTAEAFAAYDRVVGPDGVVLVHISNRYLDLAPVVAAGADATGRSSRIRGVGPGDDGRRAGSVWMAVADEARLTPLGDWSPPGPDRAAWTDAFSNLLGVLD